MKRHRILLLGAFVGALVGVATTAAILRRVDDIQRRGKRARLRGDTGDWIKLAMAVLGVARQFSHLLTPE